MSANDARRGTFWDWPTGVALAGLLLLLVAAGNGASIGMLIGAVVGAFGIVAGLARRGSFSPRKD